MGDGGAAAASQLAAYMRTALILPARQAGSLSAPESQLPPAAAGATATQVADQSDRLVAAVAQLLGAESDDTFVAATSGGPGASKAAGAQRRLLAQAGSPLQVTVVAAGADPLALYWHASAANT